MSSRRWGHYHLIFLLPVHHMDEYRLPRQHYSIYIKYLQSPLPLQIERQSVYKWDWEQTRASVFLISKSLTPSFSLSLSLRPRKTWCLDISVEMELLQSVASGLINQQMNRHRAVFGFASHRKQGEGYHTQHWHFNTGSLYVNFGVKLGLCN